MAPELSVTNSGALVIRLSPGLYDHFALIRVVYYRNEADPELLAGEGFSPSSVNSRYLPGDPHQGEPR